VIIFPAENCFAKMIFKQDAQFLGITQRVEKIYLNNFSLLAFIKKISSGESDKALVQQYKTSGSIDTLGELYNRYMELVYGVCLKYMKEPEDAKDCVINIFEELVTKLNRYEVDNFKGWLYQLAINYCLMKLRSQKNLPASVDVDLMQLEENFHPDNIMEKEQHLSTMELCMEQLPSQQKTAIRLFYLEEKCYKEIAELTDSDINKVRSYIQNGRRNLKICMEKTLMEKA
jgi:RNA polymerase sigma factor (sigma-70 family)